MKTVTFEICLVGTRGDPMGTHGDPPGPHGASWGPMRTHGDPWGPMGAPWGPMGTHWDRIGAHGTHGGRHGDPVGTPRGSHVCNVKCMARLLKTKRPLPSVHEHSEHYLGCIQVSTTNNRASWVKLRYWCIYPLLIPRFSVVAGACLSAV